MAALLHLSDLHFGTERPPVVDALLACVAAQGISVVVMSGDITQRARRSQFDRALAFVDRLRATCGDVPVLVMPGNHDIPLFNLPVRLLRPFGGFRRAFGDDLERCYADEHFHVQLVNTVTRWRHTDGVVRRTQIERVARRLADASAAQVRVVVTHQPAAVVREVDAPDRLHGHREAIRRWSQAGADVLLGGHIHLPYVQALHGDANVSGIPRRSWVVQAGTAVSSRIRHEADNSFNIIRHAGEDGTAGPKGCVVERWDYIAAEDHFARRARLPLELQRE